RCIEKKNLIRVFYRQCIVSIPLYMTTREKYLHLALKMHTFARLISRIENGLLSFAILRVYMPGTPTRERDAIALVERGGSRVRTLQLERQRNCSVSIGAQTDHQHVIHRRGKDFAYKRHLAYTIAHGCKRARKIKCATIICSPIAMLKVHTQIP